MLNFRPQPLMLTIDFSPTNIDQRLLPETFSPCEIDILCGRGRAFVNHHGNKIFKNAIHDNLRRYIQAPKRFDKSLIAASIGSSLRDSGARFLKQDKKSKRYSELSDDQAHEKISHAFRDVLKGLDSSRTPLQKCVFSLDEKPGTMATISQEEPVVPIVLNEALFSLNEKDSAVPLQHSVIPLTVSELSSSECWFLRDETLSSLDISPSMLLLDENEEITAIGNPDLPTLDYLLDELEHEEQDADRPSPLSSETTFEFQDIWRMFEILSQDKGS
jgi:hypothetical protein